MTPYTIRYYENSGLIPDVDRSGGNAPCSPNTLPRSPATL